MHLTIGSETQKRLLESYREGSLVVLKRDRIEVNDGYETKLIPVASALPHASVVRFLRDVRYHMPTFERATCFLYKVGENEAQVLL